MARDGRGAGRWFVVLAVGIPPAVAAIVMAVVFTGTGALGRGPLHRAVDSYLDAVGGEGAVPVRGPDSDCPSGQEDPATALRGFAASAFGHHIVSSTETGDSASVNVDLAPEAGAPMAVVLDLRRTGDRWDVCAASTGRVQIDPDPF
ncbi:MULTISPECIES: hypothetical protein [unclassified Streptomyces]|uniref:hypothetical protein n=1 Tax=unclassified Streptomyces TaxID=2593676 RepID=UPI0029BD3307|nr:hypothetical protein [Streptomyces sp. DK15]MDX2389276.1 hypothetical protein [Streptomyces sp. DK15]